MKEMTTKLEEEVSVAAKAAKREAAKLQQRVSKKRLLIRLRLIIIVYY